MRIELIIFGVVAFLIANVYKDGKYWKLLQANKKYYKMAGIALGGVMLYVLFKKFPAKATDIIRGSNEYIKYLPIDRETSSMLSPILDFTAKQNIRNSGDDYAYPVSGIPPQQEDRNVNRIVNSGNKATKR